MKDYMRHEEQLQGEPVKELTTYEAINDNRCDSLVWNYLYLD